MRILETLSRLKAPQYFYCLGLEGYCLGFGLDSRDLVSWSFKVTVLLCLGSCPYCLGPITEYTPAKSQIKY